MFGLYELRLPSGLETRLAGLSNRFKGGRFAGVLAMGALSALILSPCVAAPLAGALLYIGQTHDVFVAAWRYSPCPWAWAYRYSFSALPPEPFYPSQASG